MCLTETWLSETDTAVIASLLPDTHVFHHFPRIDGRGGGVGIAVAKFFENVKSFRRVCDYFECLEVKISHQGNSFVIYIIYRPPNNSMSNFLYEFESFCFESERNADQVIYVGDFNVWIEDVANENSMKFRGILDNFNLKNYISEPTFDSGHVLDLVIAGKSSNIMEDTLAIEPVCTISDHRLVSFNLDIKVKRIYEKIIYFRNSKGIDSAVFNENISRLLTDNISQANVMCCDLGNELGDTCVDCIMKKYRNCAQSFYDENAPLIRKVIKINDRTEPWYNSDIISAKREMRKMEKKFIAHKSDYYREEFKRLRQVKCNLVTSSKISYYRNKIDLCKSDPKRLFNELNKMLGKKDANIVLPSHSCPKALANDFMNFFVSKIENISSTFNNISNLNMWLIPDFPLNVFDKFCPVAVEKVSQIICRLNRTHCLNDPVDVRALNFDVVLGSFSQIMTDIINKSFWTGRFPCSEKFSLVKPLIKGKLDPDILGSYRPLYNTSFSSKILESASYDQLLTYLSNFPCFPKFQSAYRKFYSVETAMCRVYNELVQSKCSGKCTLMAMLDLTAAFDTVNHGILLEDLERFGLSGKVLSWFESYLKDREFKVVIGRETSEYAVMKTGVPQGSILGPILFIIYTAELQYLLESMGTKFHLYADDTQIFFEISNVDDAQNKMTEVYNAVEGWMKGRNLKLNAGKTEFMFIGSESHVIGSTIVPGITVGGTFSEFKSTIKSLGVTIDKGLSLKPQIKNVKRKAIGNLINISRISKFLDEGSRLKLIHGLVFSHIDFCNSLYYGLPNTDLRSLQLIIHSAARVVAGMPCFSHDRITPVCIDLHFLPIKARIIYKICLLTYKAMNFDEPRYLRELLMKRSACVSRQMRSHDEGRLVEPYLSRLVSIRRCFEFTAPRLYNCLPVDVLTSDLVTFKRKLKTHLFQEAYDLDLMELKPDFKL